MITVTDGIFHLATEHTSYVFQITETGHLEHLYYGAFLGEITAADAAAMTEKRAFAAGNVISYDEEHPTVTMEDICLEMSCEGHGDIRPPFLTVIHADGSRTSDFIFKKYEITPEKVTEGLLPGAHDDASAPATDADAAASEHLTVTLKDRAYGVTLELYYDLYPACDTICRRSRLVNTGSGDLRLLKLMSTQLDFPDTDYVYSSFTGGWGREMNRTDTLLHRGAVSSGSAAGTSSSRANPFVMLSRPETTEDAGECFGLNLVYSGNHLEEASVNGFDKTRFLAGIHPQHFEFRLAEGESFETPEAVMVFSDRGFGEMSRRMHAFVRNHIMPAKWGNTVRPILLNSWEAAYFAIDEGKLLRLAKAGKSAGVELFVVDDGWFGVRNDDLRSLGDWTENRKKLPEGLRGLAEKVNALGLAFGIWVEPEMVNQDSNLYRAHPDWAMEIPGKPHSEGRPQRILDFANPAVVDHITEEMTRVFSSANIAYVKWDMNRIWSDAFSQYLPAERQGETAHRYMLGLYRVMRTLTERFPEILFEGCASGGNRFDLGILAYFPQIWGSDDSDALQRARLQEGLSYGYPLISCGAHVSDCPNHQTLRNTPLDTRFNVAAFGAFGYEINLCDLPKSQLTEIAGEIELYKKWRPVFQLGSFFRGRIVNDGGKVRQIPVSDEAAVHEWTVVSEDGKSAVGLLMQELTVPNRPYECYRAKGLDPDRRYHFRNIPKTQDIRSFGGLINNVAPVHIKPGSLLHTVIAKRMSQPGEQEDVIVSGRVLMRSGVKLLPAFAGTGYNEKVRYFQDFCSRLYFMEEAPAKTS